MKKLYKDQVLGIISLIIALFAGVSASKIPEPIYEGDPGAAVIPFIGVFILVICGIILIIKPQKKEGRTYLTKEEWLRAINIFVCYLIYLLLLWAIGFVPTIPIITFILTYVLYGASMPDAPKKQRILKSLIFAVIASAAIIGIYKYGLKTQLPRGMYRKWFK